VYAYINGKKESAMSRQHHADRQGILARMRKQVNGLEAVKTMVIAVMEEWLIPRGSDEIVTRKNRSRLFLLWIAQPFGLGEESLLFL
jgi:hypothetical protein